MTKGIVQTGEYYSNILRCNIIVTKQVLGIIINRHSKEQSYDRFNAQLISRNDISLDEVANLWNEMLEKDSEELKAIQKTIGKTIQIADEVMQPVTATWVARNASEAKGANLAEHLSETGEIDRFRLATAVGIPFAEMIFNELPAPIDISR